MVVTAFVLPYVHIVCLSLILIMLISSLVDKTQHSILILLIISIIYTTFIIGYYKHNIEKFLTDLVNDTDSADIINDAETYLSEY